MGFFTRATFGALWGFRAGVLCVCAGIPELRLDTVRRAYCIV